ncbi:VOC family protein [Caulobacter flavus]|uniref:VOC family protein n=1 Tax=Caulobacter flavus TaxID=1679497 RepID=A0A2N5CVB0_9CAUL|nr:VOC family protein [Caulobacter flavus]AYV48896.1 VOC family protein [Caulobacter flavus]PLR17726.1 VOC family protein [Caulobacter flavus]
MSPTVRPFLMFQNGVGPDALDFYVSVFPGSVVEEVELYGPAGPGPQGTIKTASFTIGDQSVMCSDSFVKHRFDFTPSFSFFVTCTTPDEVDRLAGVLGEGGGVLMPPGNYGFSPWFAWVSDRFGVSWQLNVGED